MNLLITSAPARAMLHFVLVTLALMPALIYGHGHHGNGKKHARELADIAHGAQLVMETRSGDVHVRPARQALPEERPTVPAAPPATPTAVGGGNKRVKNNNKKSNKAQNQMQHASGSGRRNGYKKSAALNGEEQQQQQGHHNNGKQQRQLAKHPQQEHQHRTGKRSGAKKASEKAQTCRYTKSSWTECDTKTNMRTRTLSLKKGDSNCLPTRSMQKTCKKSCRYEKGTWSECVNGQITREDKLKPADDGSPQSTCNPVRVMNKKCKSGGAGGARSTKERKHKEKGSRRTSPQA
ncbi:uncharacterized protein LOC117788917 [Drosophila innubila]|uniref:uncharacterized protein LOC117788917 n=1 Tax=Drosophila innubila TaxID=198719 RepID=UPI00148D4A00|nr:uncharacterized protein LOC117788917 [Drosophila innubila]